MIKINSSESSWAGKIVDGFDASGRITWIQAYNEETPSDVVSDVSYYYTANASAKTICGGTPPTGDTSLVRYSVNNVTSVTSIYCYDGGDRLTKVTNDNSTTYNYAYNGDGGSESISYAGASQDQPLSDGSATGITYGRAGQDGQPSVDSYSSGGAANYIIRDQQGDPLGMVRGTSSYMFVTDNVGSVTAIVDYCGCTDATYAYAADNPANYTDPTGHALIAGLIGVAGAIAFGRGVASAVVSGPVGLILLAGSIAIGEPVAVYGLVCGFATTCES